MRRDWKARSRSSQSGQRGGVSRRGFDPGFALGQWSNSRPSRAWTGHPRRVGHPPQDIAKSGINPAGSGMLYAGENLTPYQSEQRAYGVTDQILKANNETRNFNCGVNPCTLGRGVMTGTLPGVIDQIVGHSAHYNQLGRPMSSTNQGISVVNGVHGPMPRVELPPLITIPQ